MIGNQRGQMTAIITAILVIGIALGAWYFVWHTYPEETPGPPVGGGDTVEAGYVRTNVTVKTRYWKWDNPEVEIEDETIETKTETVPASILGSLSLFGQEIEGEVVVVVKKDGEVKDRWSKSYELDEGMTETQETDTFQTKWLKMGSVGSGRYTLKATMYNLDGEIWDTATATVSI